MLSAVRGALEKMIQVYQMNPSLGDPKVVERQLDDRSRTIDALNVEKHKFEVSYSVTLFGLEHTVDVH